MCRHFRWHATACHGAALTGHSTISFRGAGSARGIGRSTARLLAALGASVFITDMRAADIAAAVAAISAVVPG